MKRRGRFIGVSLASLFLLLGCRDGADKRTGDAIHKDRQASTAKHEFLQKVAADLNEIEQYVAEVSKEVKTNGSSAKAELREMIDAIEPMLEEARSKLDELRPASEDSWADLQRGMDRTMDKVKKAYQELKDKGRKIHLLSSSIYGFRRLAENWTGKLIDASCYNRDKRAACEPTDATTAFALNVAGKTYNFDAGGNAKASEALKNRADRADPAQEQSNEVMATVEGMESRETIMVESITVR
jgi:hypothetical protein